jgi:hypothetical protein
VNEKFTEARHKHFSSRFRLLDHSKTTFGKEFINFRNLRLNQTIALEMLGPFGPIGATAYMPRWTFRTARPPVHVGQLNDRTDIIHFIRCMPADWQGFISRSSKQLLSGRSARCCLDIYAPGNKQVLVFRLYFDQSFLELELYFMLAPSQQVAPLTSKSIGEQGRELTLPVPDLKIIAHCQSYLRHPFIVLGNRLNSVWMDEKVDDSALLLFPAELGIRLEARRHRELGCHNFLESKILIHLIFTLGAQFFVSDDQVLAPETEAQWRIQVYKRMGISGWSEIQ